MHVHKHIYSFLFVLLLFAQSRVFSQATNTNCANPTPFCTGQTMNFPAVTGNSQAQAGPNYGCLGGQPRPTWFYFQINNGGPFIITMAAANDIDFICWGPFPSLSGACNSLTTGNTQDCSFSGSATETCTINNAIPGQFYLLLITNWSGSTQNITFTQANANSPGAATTNCGFVCAVTPTNSGRICPGQSNTISVTTSTAVTSYTWFGPNGFTSNNSFAFLNNIQSTVTYTVRGSTGATSLAPSSTCQAVTTITVVPFPVFNVNPTNTTICQGGMFFATTSFSLGSIPAAHLFTWSPIVNAGVFTPNAQNTNIAPPLLPTTVSLATVIYSVTVSPSLASCPITQTLAVTINNPLTPTLTMPSPMCNISAPITLTASPSGGVWSGNTAVAPNGLFSPAIAAIPTNPVLYTISIGSCQVSVSDTLYVAQYNTPALTASLSLQCVQDPAVNLMTLVQTTVGGSWSGTGVSSNSITNTHIFNPANLASGVYNLTYSTVSTPFPFYSVCPASTVLAVTVFNPPTPTINPIKPVCDVDPPVQLVASPSGGLWTQNSGVSSLGVQTPSLCGIGSTNNVVYTAGIGTCVASSSATFHVSKFISAALTGTVANLCVTNNPVNLMNIVQNTLSGVWTGPNILGTYSFNPGGLPTNTYALTYSTQSFPDPQLCPDRSAILVSVLNPPVPSITQVGPYCSTRGPVQLSVTPNTGSWTAVPYLNNNGVFSPSLASIGGNQVQYIIGTSTCNTQQTKTVNVEAFVPSTIVNAIPDLCNSNSPFSLLPITISNSGIWSGPGVLGANFDPGVTGAGTYTLLYSTASSPSGLCPSQSTVAVNVYSLATPVITKPIDRCNNSPSIKLEVSPVGGLFAGNNNGAITTQGIFNPALAIIGNNIVSYSIASGPCIAFAQTTINIEKFVSASFANPQDIYFCRNDKPVNLESYVLNPNGNWSASNGGLVGNTSMFDPALASLGVSTVSYQIGPPNNMLLCPDTKTVKVIVNPSPSVSLTSDKYQQCSPLVVTLGTVLKEGSPDGTAYWYFGDGSDTEKGQPLRHTFVTPGVYTVVANFVSAQGCSVQAMLNPITVLESPKARFDIEPDDISISNPDVTLVNRSTVFANNRYEWNISGMVPRAEITPQVSFPAIGKYTITLKATSFQGCVDEITKLVEVKNDFNVFIPSSFSPNEDGLNDTFIPVFSPYGLDVTSFEMEIFDRWGQSIYHTKDHTKGWDGTLNNKSTLILKQETYIYKIKYRDLDGRLYNRMGNVTLMTND